MIPETLTITTECDLAKVPNMNWYAKSEDYTAMRLRGWYKYLLKVATSTFGALESDFIYTMEGDELLDDPKVVTLEQASDDIWHKQLDTLNVLFNCEKGVIIFKGKLIVEWHKKIVTDELKNKGTDKVSKQPTPSELGLGGK